MLKAASLRLAGRLTDASLAAAPGELIGLVGPNGSGKTSLLHALAGIGSPTGSIELDGVDPRRLGPALRPHYLTYLPASRDVPWPLLARDLIALAGSSSAPLEHELELEALIDRRVDSLSTGERSRVLIARALAPKPKLLLLDEPTANLDPLWQIKVMELIRREIGEGERAAIVAIHDLDLAQRYADRILIMDDGRIAAENFDPAIVAQVFGIERIGSRWEAVNRREDRRSLP
jgi:iron complex transport system ATP-binding protein